MWLPIVVPLFALLLPASPAAAQTTCPPLDVQLRSEQMDRFLHLVGTRAVRPVVLFVPGSPGSKLVRQGDQEVLFGKGRVDAGKLHLADPRNRAVEATVLERFEAYDVLTEPVYSRTLQQLREDVGAAGEVHAWGYDWRLAAGESADALQRHLKEKFSGRPVVLLGHSFGGSVAWRWQEAHDPASAGVEHLVLFGAPIGGTCEATRFLMKGFRPAAGEPDDWITRLGYRVLMGELRPSAFTFPSAYQLLPQDGCLQKLTLRPQGQPEQSPLAPRSVEFWKGPVGRQIIDEAWTELEVTPEAFWTAVERAIAEAGQSVPDPSRRRVRNVRAFFSADNPTAREIRLVVDAGDHVLRDEEVEKAGLGDDNPVVVTAPGDGRVLACNPPDCALKDICVDRINLVHGHLADSKQFRSYALYMLPPILKAVAVTATLRQLQSKDAVQGIDWAALRAEVEATGTDAAGFDRLGAR
jgi:pimeloyl-ACP methyl ester carboxylesterase